MGGEKKRKGFFRWGKSEAGGRKISGVCLKGRGTEADSCTGLGMSISDQVEGQNEGNKVVVVTSDGGWGTEIGKTVSGRKGGGVLSHLKGDRPCDLRNDSSRTLRNRRGPFIGLKGR